MVIPLSLWDASLWLSIISIILAITTEFVPPYHGKTGILINRRKLRDVSIATAIAFLITVAVGMVILVIS